MYLLNNKFFIVLIALLFAISSSFSQAKGDLSSFLTVKGTVRDQYSFKPLTSTSIIVTDIASGKSSTIGSANGKFLLKLPPNKEVSLKVVVEGYLSKSYLISTKNADLKSKNNFFLLDAFIPKKSKLFDVALLKVLIEHPISKIHYVAAKKKFEADTAYTIFVASEYERIRNETKNLSQEQKNQLADKLIKGTYVNNEEKLLTPENSLVADLEKKEPVIQKEVVAKPSNHSNKLQMHPNARFIQGIQISYHALKTIPDPKLFLVYNYNYNQAPYSAEDMSENFDPNNCNCVVYRIQLSANRKRIDPERWKVILGKEFPIDELFENGLYKYTYGAFKNYVEALEKTKKNSFKTFYIRAFTNNYLLNNQTN